MKTPRDAIDISIIITCHAEGILIHKTLASVKRATRLLDNESLHHEVIIHVDSPTQDMEEYLTSHEDDTLSGVRIFRNRFKDLGASRNFAISKAEGEFIATIDADDLMSENWLHNALHLLKQQIEPTVAHSELSVEFEGADSLIIKHGEINLETDTLLSVFANRWNSVIVAPRQLLIDNPYTPNSPGYGYEDWHLNNRLIHKGVHNLLVAQTAVFIRRKRENSEWLRQVQSMAVLRANPLLSFAHIRAISTTPFSDAPVHPALTDQTPVYKLAKRILLRYPIAHKVTKRLKHVIARQRLSAKRSFAVPEWLQHEWRSLHTIEKQLFPTKELMAHISEYDSLTPDHRATGSLYKMIVDSLHHDTYDYLLFVPWLIKGGADDFSINYANAIAQANPKKRVLVVTTMPVSSVWQERLDPTVDFLEFGRMTRGTANEIKYRLMSHIIENTGISHLHIINSEFGYNFIRLHKQYIQATNKKVVITSFSQSVDVEGRLYGYSHTHVPFVYDIATLITSDNQAVLSMWEKEYGFDRKKLIVHRQPVILPAVTPAFEYSHQIPLRILWAARIAPEKQPELLASIGRKIQGIATIDIYGTIEEGAEKHLQNLPSNTVYKGGFDGFASLPVENYDYLLYTSLFDGMPNTLLHAASAGLPIITSAVGGIPEFINKDTGVLIDNSKSADAYADAIIEAAKNPAAGVKQAKNAYTKLEADFSPTAYTTSIRAFLKRLEY